MNLPSARNEIKRRSGGRTRRGFTLLELIMASTLGVVIVLASFSLMAAMRSTDERTKDRNAASAELSRTHQVMSRAFGSIVVKAPQPRTVRPTGAAAKPEPTAGTDTKDPAAEPHDLTPPRVLLETDPANPGQQRFELTISEPPIMAGADGGSLPGERAEWFSKSRGAFELKPAKSGTGLDLFWVVYPLPVEDDSLPGADGKSEKTPVPSAEGLAPPPVEAATDSPRIEQSNEPLATLLVSRNLEKCNFRLVRSGEDGKVEPLTEARVVTEDELPAYLELDIATTQGQTATWMFEVGWTVEPRKLPGARSAAEALRRASAAGGSGGSGSAAGGRGSFGSSSKGSGSGGGGSGQSRDSKGKGGGGDK